MYGNDSTLNMAPTHNQSGCPYLNQTGYDAVQSWAQVLAQIDLQSLPADLQAELQQLRNNCSRQGLSGDMAVIA